MSTKQLRRLANQKEVEKRDESDEEEEGETGDSVKQQINTTKNKFSSLFEEQAEEDVLDEDKNDDRDEVSVPSSAAALRAKRTKQKKKAKKNAKNADLDNVLDDAGSSSKLPQHVVELSELDRIKQLMKIQWVDLNPDTELKKVLGAGFRMSLNPQRGRGQRKQLPQFKIVQKDPTWLPVDGSGLSVIPDNGFDSPKPGYTYFKFHHSPGYQVTQQFFWDVMDSPDPQFQLILEASRYHLDALLVYIQQLIQADDSREARKFTDFGIYICESVMPAGFEMLSPSHCLLYEVKENRAFYMFLMWHLKFLITRRCFYTALQVAKLIFIKDMSDPLAMCLIIDSLAIKSGSYQFLLDFYEEFKTSHNLDGLPNIRYSLAIATHLLAVENSDSDLDKVAENLLFDALSFYPDILAGICDQMAIKPTEKVVKTLSIDEFNLASTPKGLKVLEQIYVCHNFENVWKKDDFMTWIETATENLVNTRAKQLASTIKENRNKQKQIFVGMAQPVARHGYLFDLYPTAAGIPAVDPLPPLISRAAYFPNERLTIDTTDPQPSTRNERLTMTSLLQGLLNTINPEYQAPTPLQPPPRNLPEEE